jgi:hypothetical protein
MTGSADSPTRTSDAAASAGDQQNRRVRDRIDREYAQPLDVEALVGG